MRAILVASIALVMPHIVAVRHDSSLPAARAIHELGHIQSRRLTLDAENTPLYPGYGTHFSYIYVGTPPKRQSVIIDTGSHYTAFPCKGCDQCGQHTDPYFDPSESSTAIIPSCGSNSRCSISQSYTEGSSWQAYKVIDKLYVGGLTSDLVQHGADYTVDFMFGCQTHETGLFRTQLADGIMGMSMDPATLMPQLKSRKITSTTTFALCFRVGGGVMTLGGVDQSLHMSEISYAKLTTASGWFTVRILDIYLQSRGEDATKVSLGAGGSSRGYIVDSGTTDTYLPSSLRSAFVAAFKQLSGVTYSNNAIVLTEKELEKLPDVYVTMEGRDGTPISVPFPWGSYIDNNGNGKYTFRIYLTEGSGGVLGANFMNNKNVIFDAENGRVGFAESQCKYEEVNTRPTAAPTPQPTPATTEPCKNVAYAHCDAKCDVTSEHSTPYVSAAGYQEYRDTCSGLRSKQECHVLCSANNMVIRGDSASCVNSFWSECSNKCKQNRVVSKITDDGKCSISSETRSCYSNECAMAEGDFMLLLDVRWMYKPAIVQWSDVYEEDLFDAFAAVLGVPAGNMDLLVDSNAEHSVSLKLQVQVRIAKSQSETVSQFNKRAQDVLSISKNKNFGEAALEELIDISARLDSTAQLDRYGWLRHIDDTEPLSVLHAVLLPYGQARDPAPVESSDSGHHSDTFVYFMIGVALAAIISLICLGCAYCRLRQIHDDMTKDKPFTLLPSRSVKEMWQRFRNRRSIDSKNYKPVRTSDIAADNNLDDDDNGFL